MPVRPAVSSRTDEKVRTVRYGHRCGDGARTRRASHAKITLSEQAAPCQPRHGAHHQPHSNRPISVEVSPFTSRRTFRIQRRHLPQGVATQRQPCSRRNTTPDSPLGRGHGAGCRWPRRQPAAREPATRNRRIGAGQAGIALPGRARHDRATARPCTTLEPPARYRNGTHRRAGPPYDCRLNASGYIIPPAGAAIRHNHSGEHHL